MLEALKLAPTLVPAAALAGRFLAEGGQLRKACRVIDKAWRANPHPELAEAYAELRYGDAARDRLKRIEALARKRPGHVEGALAVARAALDAQEFAKARAALAPYLEAPTKRVALLMAELERAERNDEGRAREWMARALHAAPDPAWTADGYVSDIGCRRRRSPAGSTPSSGACRFRHTERAGDRARAAGGLDAAETHRSRRRNEAPPAPTARCKPRRRTRTTADQPSPTR